MRPLNLQKGLVPLGLHALVLLDRLDRPCVALISQHVDFTHHGSHSVVQVTAEAERSLCSRVTASCRLPA